MATDALKRSFQKAYFLYNCTDFKRILRVKIPFQTQHLIMSWHLWLICVIMKPSNALQISLNFESYDI